MKTSELIKKLQAAIDKHGDLDLSCPDGIVSKVDVLGLVNGVQHEPPLLHPCTEIFVEVVGDS